jgi:hypothetical protein
MVSKSLNSSLVFVGEPIQVYWSPLIHSRIKFSLWEVHFGMLSITHARHEKLTKINTTNS